MKKDSFFVGLVKRGITMLLLTVVLTTTQAKWAGTVTVPGTECAVCGEDGDEDEEIYFGPSIPEQ